MADYIDLTEIQKEKLIANFRHEEKIIGNVYVTHEDSRANGYMVFVYDKKKILCESNVKHFNPHCKASL